MGDLRLAVEDFTSSLYEAGAFAGRTPQEAFFVRCDRTTMTQDDLDAGVVTIVGVRTAETRRVRGLADPPAGGLGGSWRDRAGEP